MDGIRPVAAARATGCPWFLPLLFALTCVVGSLDLQLTGYVTGDLASVSLGLELVGPVTAAYVAARFRGFPRFAGSLRSVRTGAAAVAGAWWPLLLGAPLTVGVAVCVTARAVPRELSSWEIVVLDLAAVLGCAVLGLVVSWALPVVLAVPVVGVSTFLWFAFTGSSTNVLLHTMNSSFAACCASSTEPEPGAVLAGTTVGVVIVLGSALLLLRRRWARMSRLVLVPAVALVVLAALGLGAAVATATVDPLTLQALRPRTTHLECRTTTGIGMCLWPESRGRTAELADVATTVNRALGRWGLDPVTALTQGADVLAGVPVEAGSQLSQDDLRYSVAAGYVDHRAGCLGAEGRARDQLVAFVTLAAGAPEASVSGGADPKDVAVAAARLNASPGSVRAWFGARLAAVRCGYSR